MARALVTMQVFQARHNLTSICVSPAARSAKKLGLVLKFFKNYLRNLGRAEIFVFLMVVKDCTGLGQYIFHNTYLMV
jgi:hypothetical protein